MKRVAVGITGASGSVYGIRLLDALRGKAEVHLVVSEAARIVIAAETPYSLDQVTGKADYVYRNDEIGCSLSSGSSRLDAMVVMPCSVKTLSAVANSYADTLIARIADVTLKERRLLVLGVRETPLHAGHLRLMQTVADLGGVIAPPVPSFYNRPASLDDIIDQSVGRVLQLIGIESGLVKRWQGAAECARGEPGRDESLLVHGS